MLANISHMFDRLDTVRALSMSGGAADCSKTCAVGVDNADADPKKTVEPIVDLCVLTMSAQAAGGKMAEIKPNSGKKANLVGIV